MRRKSCTMTSSSPHLIIEISSIMSKSAVWRRDAAWLEKVPARRVECLESIARDRVAQVDLSGGRSKQVRYTTGRSVMIYHRSFCTDADRLKERVRKMPTIRKTEGDRIENG